MLPKRGSFIVLSAITLLSYAEGRPFAATLHYTDVPSDAWFGENVELFLAEGYLDATTERFRPADPALRSEFAKLIVELSGGILDDPPPTPSFSDVDRESWYYGYLEEAAREGWLLGDDNCYGRRPCTARPAAAITRAEAAKLIQRTFTLSIIGLAPRFPDVARDAWYSEAVQAAADHCVLRGDDWTGMLRPRDAVNRAEIVSMLARIDEQHLYPDCFIGEEIPPAETAPSEEESGEGEAENGSRENGEDAEREQGTAGSATEEGAGASIFEPALSPPAAPSSPAPSLPAAPPPPNLFVTADPTSLPPRQILAGALSPPILHLEFTARGADIDATSLALEPAGGTIPSSVASLLLLFPGTHTPFATLFPRDCARPSVYCAVIPSGVLRIPADGKRDVLVQASLTRSGGGAKSGERFALTLQPGDITAKAGERVMRSDDGDGVGGGEIFVGADDPSKGSRVIEGPWNEAAFAKILAVTNGTPIPDGSPLSVGDFSIGQFTFTAAAGANSTYDVLLESLIVELDVQGVRFVPNSFHIINTDEPDVSSLCDVAERGGGATITCSNLGASDVDREISDGEQRTFALRATITSFSPGSFLQAFIGAFTSPFLEGSITWSDERTTFRWVEHQEKEVRSTRFEGK
jgi:hypothetical protein